MLDKPLKPNINRRSIGIEGRGLVTYSDINLRYLALPNLVFPYRRALLRHAESAYSQMKISFKGHEIGLVNAPLDDAWGELVRLCASVSDCQNSDWAQRYGDNVSDT